jgi:hypothetical protein
MKKTIEVDLAYAARLTMASVFVAAGAGTAHVALLGKAGALAVPFVILCAIGAGLCLWGRFDWTTLASRLVLLAHALREAAGTSAKLAAFVSGLMWLAFGIVLARLVWMIFGSSLIGFNGDVQEVLGWFGMFGAAFCLIKGAADWSLAFKGAANLENEHVHGDARLATEHEAAAAARGAPRLPNDRGTDFDY